MKCYLQVLAVNNGTQPLFLVIFINSSGISYDQDTSHFFIHKSFVEISKTLESVARKTASRTLFAGKQGISSLGTLELSGAICASATYLRKYNDQPTKFRQNERAGT